MRKLQNRDTIYAENGRLNKAIELSGFIAKNYGPVTTELIEALPTQEWAWWLSLSKAAKCNPPSPATVDAVCGLLAQHINESDNDPFDGLPAA